MSGEPVLRCEIRRARNGWILKVERPSFEDGEPDEVVCEERHEDEIECFSDFLWALNEELGPSTSRYSPKRICIRVEPGDKCEDAAGGNVSAGDP